MNIRFVEYGKRFVRHGTTDFVVLAASDQDIIKNLGYFRSILKYPSRTSFNNNLGSVSVTLLAFNEGFLFVQLQNRREDELSGSESQMRRPFNQIRFSFLSRDDLLELFSKGKAVYTSLLFSDPNKKTQFLLSDYADEKVSESVLRSDSGILMSTRQDLIHRYETVQFHNDVETITDTLATYLKNGKNSLVDDAVNIILKHLPQDESLLYKLVLLQEAQHYLFPFRQLITFALDNVTEQNVVIRFYDSDYVGTTKSSQKPTSPPDSIGYYQAIKLLEDYLYEDNLARYIKSKLISMDDLVKLYPLTKGKSKFQSVEHTALLLKYYPLLLNDPTKEKDIPNDFYHVISQFSRDDMVNLLNSEPDEELSQWLVNVLRLTPAELIYVFTSLKQQRRDKMLPSFINTLPVIDIHVLEGFSSDQLDVFWKSILSVARNRKKKLVFASGKSVIGVLLNKYLSSREAIYLQHMVAESLAVGSRFTDTLMSELADRNYTISDLLQMIAICNAVSESGAKDQKWNDEFCDYFTTEILKAAINICYQSNYSSDYLDWERLISHIIYIQKKSLLEIMVLHQAFIEELTHVFSNVAEHDIGFAKNWLFSSFRHSYTHRDLFVKIYDVLRLKYNSRIEQLDAKKHLDETDAGFYYLVSIGVFPKDYSILQSLKVVPESSSVPHDDLYLVVELWMRQNWWTDSTQLGSDDIEMLINDIQECRDISKAQHINKILVFIIQHQQNACRNIDAQLGKKWLQSALKTWDQPGSQKPSRLYDSYSVATSEGTKNDLWACLSGLNNPDEEIIWELSGMDEVLSGSLEKCQESLAKWYLKMANLPSVDERLAEYLKVSQTDFPQSYQLDGSVLKIIRTLVDVKHSSATYKCTDDKEAELLLAIIQIVQEQSITDLANRSLQKFIDESKHISEVLFLKLLDTDIRIKNKLFSDFINAVSAKHSFTTQINSLNAKQVGRIHAWAEDVSARPVLEITSRRLIQLNTSLSPQKPEKPKNTRSEAAQLKVDPLPADDSHVISSKTESESDLPDIMDNQKKNNIENMVANDENDTVTISKTTYRVIIFLLVLFLIVDLVMIVQYVIVLPQLLGL